MTTKHELETLQAKYKEIESQLETATQEIEEISQVVEQATEQVLYGVMSEKDALTSEKVLKAKEKDLSELQALFDRIAAVKNKVMREKGIPFFNALRKSRIEAKQAAYDAQFDVVTQAKKVWMDEVAKLGQINNSVNTEVTNVRMEAIELGVNPSDMNESFRLQTRRLVVSPRNGYIKQTETIGVHESVVRDIYNTGVNNLEQIN